MTWGVESLRPRQSNWERIDMRQIELPNIIWLGAYQRVERDRHPLRAMVSVDLLDDFGGGIWLHLSVSRTSRLPTWADLCKTRDEFGYADRVFVQLLPPTSFWLNVAGYTLHIVSRLDGESVPRVLYDQVGADGKHYGKPAAIDRR